MRSEFKSCAAVYPTGIPLLFLCGGIIAAGRLTLLPLPSCLCALAMILIVLPFTLKKGRTGLKWLVAGVLFFLIGLNLSLDDLGSNKVFQPPRKRITVHATVDAMVSSGPGFRVLLLKNGVNAQTGEPLPGKGRLFLRSQRTDVSATDRIGFRTILRKPQNRGNPGEFDWELDCRINGILWLASAAGEDSVLVIRRGFVANPRVLLFIVREKMRNFIEAHSQGDVRAVLKGVVVGDMGELTPELMGVFASSGLAHLLSASGVHMGIVAFLAFLLVKAAVRMFPSALLTAPLAKIAAVVSIPSMLFYCVLVGSRIPAIRSMIMGGVVAAGILMDRGWHSLNTLGFAALAVLLVYPWSLFSVSFQLSFAAVFGIFFVGPHLLSGLWDSVSARTFEPETSQRKDRSRGRREQALRLGRKVAAFMLTTIAATLAVTPILLGTFHAFPTYTLPANLAAWPLMTVALPAAIVAALIGTVFPTLGLALLVPARVLTQWIIDLARFCSALPANPLRFEHFGTLEILCYAALAFSLLWLMRAPSRKRLLCVSLAWAVLLPALGISAMGAEQGRVLRVIFLNVGKADAALIQPPAAPGVLIDAGLKTPYFDAGMSVVLPFLRWKNVRSLDGIVISHPQMDHMGGVPAVMSTIAPSGIWWNPIRPIPAFMEEILAGARGLGIPVHQADRAQPVVELGGCELRFLNIPGRIMSEGPCPLNINNTSVVCTVSYGKLTVLFTGDLESDGEKQLLASGIPLRATVLKVGHHGCGNATSVEFLRAVRPRAAVISCDEYLTGKCPVPEVLQRLESMGVEVFWTGRDGAVTLETDGEKITVTTARSARRWTCHVETGADNSR